MLRANEAENTRTESRDQTDLKREYRPIGIGAVAAALTVTSKTSENQSHAANSNDRRGAGGTLAA